MPLPSDIHTTLEALTKLGWRRQRRCSPDLIGQLRDCVLRPVDQLLIVAADVDGYGKLQLDAYVDHQDDFLAGINWLRCLQTVKTIIAYRLGETRPPRGTWTAVAIEHEHEVDPSLLLLKCYKRKLRPPNLPTQSGVLVIDAVDVVALGLMARNDAAQPMLPVLVLDHAGKKRIALHAPAEQTLGELLDHLHLTGKIVHDGPQRRQQRIDAAVRIDRTELVLHVSAPSPLRETQVCVRCGLCEVACPVRLQPAMLLEAAQEEDPSLADRFHATSCIGCGLCTNICPSQLPIWPAIRKMTRV